MGQVIASGSMSLDGFVAYDDHSVGALFEWYGAGVVEVANAGGYPPFRLTPESAAYWRWTERIGAVVVGRATFDVTDGWKGAHPFDVPVVVLTHRQPVGWSYPGSERFFFVTGGIEAAVERAREVAGGRDVCLTAGSIASQAMQVGLVDEVRVDLVPVVLGSGRPFFTSEVGSTVLLTDPAEVVRAHRVTHLRFAVAR